MIKLDNSIIPIVCGAGDCQDVDTSPVYDYRLSDVNMNNLINYNNKIRKDFAIWYGDYKNIGNCF